MWCLVVHAHAADEQRLVVDRHAEGVGATGLQVADSQVRLECEDVAADDEDRGRELVWLEGDAEHRLVGDEAVGLIDLLRWGVESARRSKQRDRTVRKAVDDDVARRVFVVAPGVPTRRGLHQRDVQRVYGRVGVREVWPAFGRDQEHGRVRVGDAHRRLECRVKPDGGADVLLERLGRVGRREGHTLGGGVRR